MQFIITRNSNNLQLRGTFEISENIKAKSTFYLTNKAGDKEPVSTSISNEDRQVLYRSIKNTITVNIDPIIEEYIVECANCSSFEEGETPLTYVLIPGRGKRTGIVVKSRSFSSEGNLKI